MRNDERRKKEKVLLFVRLFVWLFVVGVKGESVVRLEGEEDAGMMLELGFQGELWSDVEVGCPEVGC